MQFAEIMKENMKRLKLKQIVISRLELSRTGGITGWVTNKLNGSQVPTEQQWDKICELFGIENNKEYFNISLKRIEEKRKEKEFTLVTSFLDKMWCQCNV
jgi:hypothetical protein